METEDIITKLKKYAKHPLFSGSMIMIVGSNSANFMAYLYHVIIGRALGPVDYGELAAILSIMTIILAFFNFLGIVVVKFVSTSDKEELHNLYHWLSKFALISSVIITVALIVLTPFLSKFLHLRIKILLPLIPIVIFGIYSFVYRSILQGLLKFKEFVLSLNGDIFSRVLFGIIFVYLGWSTFGAVAAIAIAFFVAFLIAKLSLGNYAAKSGKFTRQHEMLVFTLPVMVSSIAVNSLLSTDVLLAKHFLEPHTAGIYASLATLGKIIFYGAGPISWVMFPLIAKSEKGNRNYRKIFLLSFILTLIVTVVVSLIYFLFPDLSIRLLYGKEFIEGKNYLIYFGIYMTLFTLASLFMNYFLSRNKTKVVYLALLSALIQFVGIWFYHHNIISIITVSIIAIILFLLSVIIYYLIDKD